MIELINESNLNINVEMFGYDDCFVEHGNVNEIEEKYNLTSEQIAKKVKKTYFN